MRQADKMKFSLCLTVADSEKPKYNTKHALSADMRPKVQNQTKAYAKGTVSADQTAEALIQELATKLEESNASRLNKWKKKVSTRSGAFMWVKSTLDSRKPATLQTGDALDCSPEDLAHTIAKELTSQWNTGKS